MLGDISVVGFFKKYSFDAKRLILLHKNKINDKL